MFVAAIKTRGFGGFGFFDRNNFLVFAGFNGGNAGGFGGLDNRCFTGKLGDNASALFG